MLSIKFARRPLLPNSSDSRMECSQRPQALMAEAKEMTWRLGDSATRRPGEQRKTSTAESLVAIPVDTSQKDLERHGPYEGYEGLVFTCGSCHSEAHRPLHSFAPHLAKNF